MTFTESVRTCLKGRYANFRDRAARSEFWWFVLFGIVVGLVAGQIDSILGFAPEATLVAEDGEFAAGYEASGPVSIIVSLALIIPNLAVSVRRLHDTGRSGWWLLLGIIPILGWIVLLWWYTRPSEDSPNKWGPGPHGAAALDDDTRFVRSRIPTVERDDETR